MKGVSEGDVPPEGLENFWNFKTQIMWFHAHFWLTFKRNIKNILSFPHHIHVKGVSEGDVAPQLLENFEISKHKSFNLLYNFG